MKNRVKGFTLIEIIVAIGLIGIISAGFLGVISNNYQFLFDTKKITEKAFLAQQDMELGIENAKELIASPSNGGLTMKTLSLFEGVSVSYYELANVYDGKTYYTYVSDQRLPSIAKLNISGVSAIPRFDAITTKYLYPVSNANLKGTFTNDPATIDDLMVNIYNWYVSKPGYNIPVPRGNSSTFFYMTDLPEAEVIDRYPIFPSDFYLIASQTTADLADVSSYAGRQIILTVTPAAKSGKIGNPGISLPVHINSLPETTGLALHLDASYVDPYNSTEVLSSTNRSVIKWNDLASNIGVANPTRVATATSTSKRPLVVDTDISNSFVARYIEFNTSKDMRIDAQSTSGQSISYFAIVRGRDVGREETLFVNGSYTAKVTEAPENLIQADGWYLVTGNYTSDNNIFTMGNDNIDLIELVLYKGAVDVNVVSEHLKTKYLPLDSEATIVSLYDQTDEIFVGDTYTLPSSVMADMSEGADKMVEVTWNGSIIADSPKTVVLTGTAVTDTSKTMTLTVTIKPIILATAVNLSPTSITMNIGDTQTIVGTLEPTNTHDLSINWSSSNDSVATVVDGVVTAHANGNATITATSGDGAASNTCAVTVQSNYNWPSGMILHLDASLGTVLSSTSVTNWNDLSIENNSFKQTTHSDRPVLVDGELNGMPIIRFDGSNDFFTLGTNELNVSSGSNEDFFLDSSNEFTVFVLTKSTSTSGNRTFISKSGGWGGSATYSFGVSGTDFAQVLRGTMNASSGNADFNIHVSTWDGGTHLYYVNGMEVDGHNDVGNKNNQSQFIVIGAAGGGNNFYYKGDIAEILVFNDHLSDSERELVENYLDKKWLATVANSWYFSTSNDTEGWTAGGNTTGLGQVSGGYLEGNITGNDPYIVSSNSLGINISTNKNIVLRLKNSTASTQAQVYYTTTSSTGWGEDKVVTFPILPNSDYTDYIIDMSSSSLWTGSLKQLRIDPAVNSTGTFSIDFIRIVK